MTGVDDVYTFSSGFLLNQKNRTAEMDLSNMTSTERQQDGYASRAFDIELFDEDVYCQNHDFANNISYLNVSCETNLDWSVPLYGYCSPFLLFTTIMANTLIVLVLSKRNMATPTNSVLMGKLKIWKYWT